MEFQNNTENKKMKILIVEDQFIEANDLRFILQKADYQVMGVAKSVSQALEAIAIEKPDLVFLDIRLKGKETGIDLAKELNKNHIGFIYLSANSNKSILEEAKKTHPYGFIVKPFRPKDVLITLEIACYRHKHSIESHSQEENIVREGIEAISQSSVKWETALLQLAQVLQTYIPFDYVRAGFIQDDLNPIGLLRKNFDNYEIIDAAKFSKITGKTKQELFDLKEKSPKLEFPKIYEGDSFTEIFQNSLIKRMIVQSFGLKSFIAFPVRIEDQGVFNFFFFCRNSNCFTNEHLAFLTKLETTFAAFVSAMNTHKRAVVSTNAIAPKQAPATVKENAPEFCSMIGSSKKILTVFDHIQKVAHSETSVLILGESGTGKEKVAQSIHQLSPRKNKPLVVINCGAVPDNLAESLFFGHEKGSFTGALEKRIGKFEAADGGTIFLDEIGEMPMLMQIKLLRVLQEKEIERVGGTLPIKVNVRIIAATNRNLEEEIAAGRFRLDLYYRLHVFPITVPSLRERREDIPALVSHFINTFSASLGKKAAQISDHALQQMENYEWPGNIRELEHIVQRAILLNGDSIINEVPLPGISKNEGEEKTQEFLIQSIHENERDYITYILKRCKGKISGKGGAAEILNIPASTLYSKMKKLGVNSLNQ
ncbi:sigma 54-interacting response regulator [Flavobacterium hungaricum]|uniref:Response regulator n=1 Tax=Flavobacterium hungaricum TaxID=2082725 RepID=A0ABR9THS1_9FLAO|nr:sigma 54-interacting response regulator [Flavobacterium hungaricum]MBE8724389.1 response regulator [Flavobacterium hungaricum]